MKKTLLLITLAAISLVASAQLKVTSDGKVKIASNLNNTNFNLLVGNTSFGSSRSNVGISGSTTGMTDKRNIGVIGTINAPSGFTDETNMGVFGVVSPISNTHGRNYGLCGMIGFTGDHYGGAGIYGTNYTYSFNIPTNLGLSLKLKTEHC